MSLSAPDDPAGPLAEHDDVAGMIESTARRGRLVACGFGAIILVTPAAAMGWVLDHRFRTGMDFVVFMGVVPGVPFGLIGLYAGLFWWVGRRPPIGLLCRSRHGVSTFVAPYSPRGLASGFLLALSNCGMGLGTLLFLLKRAPGPEFAAVAWTLGALWLLNLVLAVVRYVYLAPLVLTPDGLRYWTFRTRTVRWDALPPSGPPPPRRRLRKMRLPVSARTPRGYRWITVQLDHAFADSAFLTYAIYYYGTNPAVRQAIGTVEGLDQLVAAFHASALVSGQPDRHGRFSHSEN